MSVLEALIKDFKIRNYSLKKSNTTIFYRENTTIFSALNTQAFIKTNLLFKVFKKCLRNPR